MVDNIDMAQQEIEWAQKINIRVATRQFDHLDATGSCHFCEESLATPGLLFCDADCYRDFERLIWAKRMSSA